MLITFWDCEFMDYEESWDGEEEQRFYMCKHPKGNGYCDLSNKYGNNKDDCKLLDEPNAGIVRRRSRPHE